MKSRNSTLGKIHKVKESFVRFFKKKYQSNFHTTINQAKLSSFHIFFFNWYNIGNAIQFIEEKNKEDDVEIDPKDLPVVERKSVETFVSELMMEADGITQF